MPARMNDVVLVAQGLISAYGRGVACCADGLLARQQVLHAAGNRFPTPLAALAIAEPPDSSTKTPLFSVSGGSGTTPTAKGSSIKIAAPDSTAGASSLLTLTQSLFDGAAPIPPDAALFVATTVGEIERLEAEVLAGNDANDDSRLALLPQRVAEMLGLSGPVQVVSSACTSSTTALALAASAIRRGETTCALVVGVDGISEFVLSGFAALMAVDADGAKPFDADHRGMTVGSAADFALLMTRERMVREERQCLGVLGGWGMTCDANHLTGPSRDGMPLADAALTALRMAGCVPEQISAIAAHGTGTAYNDQMEMLAFKRVFNEQPRPTFSVKGGIGHTLGAAGLAGTLLALEFLRRGTVPPTVGLRHVAQEAQGWATEVATPIAPTSAILATTSGFGGVNGALVLALHTLHDAPDAPATEMAIGVVARGAFTVTDKAPLATHGFKLSRNFARFSAKTRLAYQAISTALAAAKLTPDANNRLPKRVGIIALNRDGSTTANRAYYADYVASGRVLGRGQLFAYTLPTTVAAECAIVCRLTGPLLYVAQPDGGTTAAWQAARSLLADGLADAIVLLSATQHTAQAAVVAPTTTLPPLSTKHIPDDLFSQVQA